MSVSPRTPRKIDHLVLPVGSLETARERLTRLGFTVAADARHPFGTENACVFLADGTYLEPLAIGHRETCEKAALKGNQFVARDAAYRFRRGEDGFSAVVLATDDADADHRHFGKNGISAGRKLRFSRSFTDPSGGNSKGSFKLAFAADLRSPDCFFVTCERLERPDFDRQALTRHENGAVAIREIALSETNPSDFQYMLQEILNQRDVNAHSFGMELETQNANLGVYNPAGLRAWYGIGQSGHARGLRFRAVLLAVEDIERTDAILAAAGIAVKRIGERRIVDPAPGQGYVLAFEEQQI